MGYAAGVLFKLPPSHNRTMAVEIGTRSAGLSSGMAAKFLTPEAALPGAVAAVLHNITGAIYSAVVRRFSRTIPNTTDADVGGVVSQSLPAKYGLAHKKSGLLADSPL